MNRALCAAWEALDRPAASLERVSFVGRDALPSAFRVTDLAAGAIAAAALAVAELAVADGNPVPDVVIDRRLSSFWFGSSIRPIGWDLPAPWDAIAGDYRTADGWIRLHTNAPHHRAAALAVVGSAPSRDAVSAAVAGWSADALEAAIVAAGGCAATMRSIAAWDAHPQGRAVAAEPLIDVATRPAIDRIGRTTPRARPLAGLKVLDLTRVLAGPVATRFLAGYGADVLRVDPPEWDEPGVVPDVTLGKRCARLDLTATTDRSTFEGLLAEADLLVHGYRPGALDGLGYGPAQRRAIRPDLVEVGLDAYGWSGPWQGRRGFDSLVQMSSGIADAGMIWAGASKPTPLPVQALDHATGYLIAAAAVTGLARLRVDGLASTSRLSLARTARLLTSMGVSGDDPTRAPPATADEDRSDSIERTRWGSARRLRPPAAIAGAPMAWDRAASPLGSADARWAA